VLLLVVVAAASPLFESSSSAKDIHELRLEFKRDLESLRTEVEHDLKAHLLATAEVQTVAKQRAIDLEAQIKSNGLDSQHFSDSGARVKSPTFHFVPNDIKDSLQRVLRDRMPSMDILPSLDWNRDEMVSQFQSMYAFSVQSWKSFHNKIGLQLLSIRDTIAVSWNNTQETILGKAKHIYSAAINSDWIQDPALREAIDFANEYRLEVFGWSIALLILLYNFYRYFSGRNTNELRNQRDDRRPNHSSDDEESRDKRSRNNSNADGDDYWDPPERMEDIIMEKMFQESVSAAANGHWPVVAPRVYTGGNRNKRHCTTRNRGGDSSANRNALRTPHDPSQPIPRNVPEDARVSNEERRRRARINARAFAARDKERLASASPPPAKKTKVVTSKNANQSLSLQDRRRRARINAQKFAARDKQMLSESKASNVYTTAARSVTSSSPGISKRARLQQARANAKSYGERDKQRLEQAAADSPYKRDRNV